MTNDLNNVSMSGKLDDLKIIYQSEEETFYKGVIKIERINSNNTDVLPITVSGNLLKDIDINSYNVNIKGQLRSKDSIDDESGKLKVSLYINIKEIEISSSITDTNNIELSGYIVKRPNLRTTPNGKQIADLLIACNYGKDKTAYIPCIAWGRNARFASRLKVGDYTNVQGRFQSREYTKIIDSIPCIKVAYELSINKIE